MCHNKDAPFFVSSYLPCQQKGLPFLAKGLTFFAKRVYLFTIKSDCFYKSYVCYYKKNEDASGLTHPRLVIYPLLGLS